MMRGKSEDEEQIKKDLAHYNLSNPYAKKPSEPQAPASTNPLLEDDRLKGLDPKLIELVSNEVFISATHLEITGTHTSLPRPRSQMLDRSPKVDWNDIAGLEHAKKSIKEIVVWPMLRP